MGVASASVTGMGVGCSESVTTGMSVGFGTSVAEGDGSASETTGHGVGVREEEMPGVTVTVDVLSVTEGSLLPQADRVAENKNMQRKSSAE